MRRKPMLRAATLATCTWMTGSASADVLRPRPACPELADDPEVIACAQGPDLDRNGGDSDHDGDDRTDDDDGDDDGGGEDTRWSPSELADVDGDGPVTMRDLDRLLSAWGDCRFCREDLNGDGRVDEVDLEILLREL